MSTEHRWSWLMLMIGCAERAAEAPPAEASPERYREMAMDEAAAPSGGAMPAAPVQMAAKSVADSKEEESSDLVIEEKARPEAPAADDASAATRSWFPETFLFAPLVVTDAEGRAVVDARVPDRLTTWRVLALAHDRDGHQAGTVTRFLGTLPTYVDPRVPPFLVVGDRVRLPVAVINTTETASRRQLTVSVTGAVTGGLRGDLNLPASGGTTSWLELVAHIPGEALLRASLEGIDAVEHRFPVLPSGFPDEQVAGGTLAAPREFTLDAPSDASGARVRLVLYPGAGSLLQSELDAAGSRSGVAEDAAGLLLAGRAPALLAQLGQKVDAAALRTTTLTLTQRALRVTRAPSIEVAAIYAEAALAHPDNPVLARLADRLIAQLAAQQRPDGTFGGETGWTLDRLLVTTAEATRAARMALGGELSVETRQAGRRVLSRADAAFERHGGHVEDPYTAAALLATGVPGGALAERLRGLVRDAVVAGPDGARTLAPTELSQRADGRAPTVAEATALAVLALKDDPKATWRPDLGSALLGAYRPGAGWGDGRANQVCLSAVLQLYAEAPPAQVRLTLSRGGQVLVDRSLDLQERASPTVVELALPAGLAGPWTLRADPPVAGLGYQLQLQTWRPWPAPKPGGGAELAVDLPATLTANQPATLQIRALAPAGWERTVRLGLPAGVAVDTGALDALIQEGSVLRYDTWDGGLELDLPAPGDPGLSRVAVPVLPTLAGALQGVGTSLTVGTGEPTVRLPPQRWTVRASPGD